jgi:hypothetical protein
MHCCRDLSRAAVDANAARHPLHRLPPNHIGLLLGYFGPNPTAAVPPFYRRATTHLLLTPLPLPLPRLASGLAPQHLQLSIIHKPHPSDVALSETASRAPLGAAQPTLTSLRSCVNPNSKRAQELTCHPQKPQSTPRRRIRPSRRSGQSPRARLNKPTSLLLRTQNYDGRHRRWWAS